jgi:hypothetical protein
MYRISSEVLALFNIFSEYLFSMHNKYCDIGNKFHGFDRIFVVFHAMAHDVDEALNLVSLAIWCRLLSVHFSYLERGPIVFGAIPLLK